MSELEQAETRQFAALVTGALIGSMMKAAEENGFLLVDVQPIMDADGNYEPRFYVTGQESGTRLEVNVAEALEAERARGREAVLEENLRHCIEEKVEAQLARKMTRWKVADLDLGIELTLVAEGDEEQAALVEQFARENGLMLTRVVAP
jgi:hypothetical protein